MLGLEEAIKCCEEVAEKQKEKGFLANAEANRSTVYGELCYGCALEHRQLAEWLRELKQLKEQEPILDKIRAEIEELDGRYVIGDYGIYGENIPKYIRLYDALDIIDKYKAESEDKE